MARRIRGLAAVLGCLLAGALWAAPAIQVQGLFKGSAMVLIDGQQRLLKQGSRSPEGLLLVSASAREAVFEYRGKQFSAALSQHISANYTEQERAVVEIVRSAQQQYLAQAKINNRSTAVLIDTGATTMALSAERARALGVSYNRSETLWVDTASGRVRAYPTVLDSVELGAIRVSSIPAVVIEGNYPPVTLLGMSFLRYVDMREQNGIMYLQAKY